ncbi:MAG: mRNA splicing protein prp18 [Alyxoria varia]|nr:MAG: mRNA splicing protein prp18 [Alyxoria varia]
MDFSSMMSAQMAKASGSTTTPKEPSSAPSKYQRKAEVEAAREAAYRAEQAARESERIAKAERKRKLDEDEAEKKRGREAKRQRLAEESKKIQKEEQEREERERRKRLGLPEKRRSETAENGNASPAVDGKEGTPIAANEEAEHIPEEELISKLRALDQPALLFGETHTRRLKRYRRFLKQQSGESDALQNPKKSANQPISTSIEPVPESDTLVPATMPIPTDTEGRTLLARKLTTWFNLVLHNWGAALASRSSATKSTFAGQSATTSYAQSLAQLRPLFRKLETLPQNPSVLPPDLLNPMVEIVRNAQNRRYVDANDGYLKLSIGKAAWPIGVTMVGIHERSAREKLNDGDKAHIMADEATRKILQSIKRCLSFAQTKWPPEDMGQLMG